MSRRSRIVIAIAVAGLVALVFAVTAYRAATSPSWTKVRLQIAPVAPGRFARDGILLLRYPISGLYLSPDLFPPGATFYVPLERTRDYWRGTRALYEEPKGDSPFIRGRQTETGVEYGIESFALDGAAAGRYERAMLDGRLYADVELDHGGNARLEDLVIRPK